MPLKLLSAGTLVAPSLDGPKLCSTGRFAALKVGAWKEARAERPRSILYFSTHDFIFSSDLVLD
jgi:hypothetical protein